MCIKISHSMNNITLNNNKAEYRDKLIGQIIAERLEAKDMKQSELCDLTGIAKPVLNDIIKGRRNLTAEMAVLIESALGISADMLLTVQIQYELEKAYNDPRISSQIQSMSDWEIMSKHISLPVLKKLYTLNSGVKDKVMSVMRMFKVSDINEFIDTVKKEQIQTYYKKSEKLNIDNKALFTWKYYCIDIASQIPVDVAFNKNNIDTLNQEIKTILTENHNTYDRIQNIFYNYGIRLLYINKEGQVPVDGMSFWYGNNPTVVLTRRLPNIDNFAFSVMHELGHVKMHLQQDEQVYVNLDSKNFDEKETEANDYAMNSFISQKDWDEFMYKIKDFNPYTVYIPIAKEAKRLNINPQILYGRYMHDTGLYRLRRVFQTEVC